MIDAILTPITWLVFVIAIAVIGLSLTAIVPPERVRHEIYWRFRGYRRIVVPKTPDDRATPSLSSKESWRPSQTAVASLAMGAGLLALLVLYWSLEPGIASGSTIVVNAAEVGGASASEPGVDSEGSSGPAAFLNVALWSLVIAGLVSIIGLIALRPRTRWGAMVVLSAPALATGGFWLIWRAQFVLSPEFLVELCLTCGEPQPPPSPPEPVVVSVSIDGGSIAAECPRDSRTRIGPFVTGTADLEGGQPDLPTQVGRALQALRDQGQDRVLRSFVIIGSADETRFEQRRDQPCTGNIDLARCRAEKVAAALPIALGPSAVGAPPVTLVNASGGLVRWTEGRQESVSGREVRLCALWETGSRRPAPAGG